MTHLKNLGNGPLLCDKHIVCIHKDHWLKCQMSEYTDSSDDGTKTRQRQDRECQC